MYTNKKSGKNEILKIPKVKSTSNKNEIKKIQQNEIE